MNVSRNPTSFAHERTAEAKKLDSWEWKLKTYYLQKLQLNEILEETQLQALTAPSLWTSKGKKKTKTVPSWSVSLCFLMFFACFGLLDFCPPVAICRLCCIALDRVQLRRGPPNRDRYMVGPSSCPLNWFQHATAAIYTYIINIWHRIIIASVGTVVSCRIMLSQLAMLTGLAHLRSPSPPHSDLCRPATEDHNWPPLTNVEQCRTMLAIHGNPKQCPKRRAKA